MNSQTEVKTDVNHFPTVSDECHSTLSLYLDNTSYCQMTHWWKSVSALSTSSDRSVLLLSQVFEANVNTVVSGSRISRSVVCIWLTVSRLTANVYIHLLYIYFILWQPFLFVLFCLPGWLGVFTPPFQEAAVISDRSFTWAVGLGSLKSWPAAWWLLFVCLTCLQHCCSSDCSRFVVRIVKNLRLIYDLWHQAIWKINLDF